MQLNNVMVDIETLGRKPGCIILSVGAVFFNPLTGETGSTFYENICPNDSLSRGFRTDPDTVAWWKEQSDEAKNALIVNRQSLHTVMTLFSAWFGLNGGEKFWCQGASFDPPILQEALERTGVPTPWKFWNVRDTRTVYDLFQFDYKKFPREGVYHNALADAIHQVKCLKGALNRAA